MKKDKPEETREICEAYENPEGFIKNYMTKREQAIFGKLKINNLDKLTEKEAEQLKKFYNSRIKDHPWEIDITNADLSDKLLLYLTCFQDEKDPEKQVDQLYLTEAEQKQHYEASVKLGVDLYLGTMKFLWKGIQN